METDGITAFPGTSSNGDTDRMRKQIRDTYQGIIAELKKCTWPTRDELWNSTVVVIISVLMLSVFVFAADWLSQFLIRLVTWTL